MSDREPTDSDSGNPVQDDLEAWLEAARLGDRNALGQALQSLREYLLLMANVGLGPDLTVKGGASDMVQETFCQAHRRFGDFRGRSPEEWRGWLRSILVRQLAEHRRRFCSTDSRPLGCEVSLNDRERTITIDDRETPIRTLIRREREESLMTTLARLPENYREVVVARHRDKLSHEQIGLRLGISAEAARKLCERAIVRLRQEMGPAHEWP
jgi:RNA polymerase sigma-70 factor (ECF subfamily)